MDHGNPRRLEAGTSFHRRFEQPLHQGRSHQGFRLERGQGVELMGRPLVIPGDAQELDEEPPPIEIQGRRLDLVGCSGDGVCQPASAKDFRHGWTHWQSALSRENPNALASYKPRWRRTKVVNDSDVPTWVS